MNDGGVDPARWVEVVGRFGRLFHRVAGRWQSVAGLHPHGNPAGNFRSGRCELLGAA